MEPTARPQRARRDRERREALRAPWLRRRRQPRRPRVPHRSPRCSRRSSIVTARRDGAADDRAPRGSASRKFGFGFVIGTRRGIRCASEFGALPFIYGTLVSSLLALLIAVPVSLGVAIYPRGARARAGSASRSASWSSCSPRSRAWSTASGGSSCSCPGCARRSSRRSASTLGFLPFFEGPPLGFGMLAGGVILAIMIVPTIASVTREVLRAVPTRTARARSALGATRWETIRIAVLPSARSGIVGAIILGLGRALGETMAVTMVIGNRAEISRVALRALATRWRASSPTSSPRPTRDLYLSALVRDRPAAVRRHAAAQHRRRGSLVVARRAACPRRRGRAHDATSAVPRAASCVDVASSRGALRRAPPCSRSCRSSACSSTSLRRGVGGLSCDFFTELPQPVGEAGGGMGNAHRRHADAGRARVRDRHCRSASWPASTWPSSATTASATAVRFCADVLGGVPSIVVGIFVYALVVLSMQRFSALAGGIALAIMMLPDGDAHHRGAAAAGARLAARGGARRSACRAGACILRVVLRTGAPGIATGVMLAVARVAGETAPLLFTAFNNRFWSTRPRPADRARCRCRSSPTPISPYDDWHAQAWAAALVLVAWSSSSTSRARLLTASRESR